MSFLEAFRKRRPSEPEGNFSLTVNGAQIAIEQRVTDLKSRQQTIDAALRRARQESCPVVAYVSELHRGRPRLVVIPRSDTTITKFEDRYGRPATFFERLKGEDSIQVEERLYQNGLPATMIVLGRGIRTTLPFDVRFKIQAPGQTLLGRAEFIPTPRPEAALPTGI